MNIVRRIDRFFSGIEWKWSLGTLVWAIIAPTGSFILPAWAAGAAGVFAEYAPLSWVASGFLGLLGYSLAVLMIGVGRQRAVRARYDARFMRETGGVDPLSKVFEGKRIFLNDFILPSSPIVIGKTFVDCEIVGPANVYFEVGNSVDDVKPGMVDAVALSGERQFFNGFLFRDCKFRGCTFHRVTLFFQPSEAISIKELNWLNWISPMPAQDVLPGIVPPSQIEDQSSQLPGGTATETPPKNLPG